MVVRPSRRRVLKDLQALPLRALHLACEAGPLATHDEPAISGAARVVVSSAASLIIMVNDGEGEVIEREAGCALGARQGQVLSRMMVVDHSVPCSFCATATSAGLRSMVLI